MSAGEARIRLLRGQDHKLPQAPLWLLQVRALFSASLSEAVEDLARTLMHEPLRVTVGAPPEPGHVSHAVKLLPPEVDKRLGPV